MFPESQLAAGIGVVIIDRGRGRSITIPGLVAKWWQSGGKVVAKWWQSGGKVVAKWWQSDEAQ